MFHKTFAYVDPCQPEIYTCISEVRNLVNIHSYVCITKMQLFHSFIHLELHKEILHYQQDLHLVKEAHHRSYLIGISFFITMSSQVYMYVMTISIIMIVIYLCNIVIALM